MCGRYELRMVAAICDDSIAVYEKCLMTLSGSKKHWLILQKILPFLITIRDQTTGH